MVLSAAIEGYLLDTQARRLSPHTISDYTLTFRRFMAFLGDVDIEGVTVDDARRFMASLTNAGQLSGKTCRNIYTGLSALWTWALSESIVKAHIWRKIKPPRADTRAVIPFTELDIRAILRAAVRGTVVKNGRSYPSRLHMAKRNKAIILMLLDTGARASELCALRVGDFDATNARIRVMGKGRRERLIDFSPVTARAVWRYLQTRPGHVREDALFTTDDGRQLTRSELGHLVAAIGKRASVSDCYPHRFRHTFAVMSLTNGVDSFTLQTSLGHSSMEMVRRYANVARVDTSKIQRRSSPVNNMALGAGEK